MNSWLEWKLALRNLTRNRRRSISTGFALVIAFVGISMLAGHVIKSDKGLRALMIYVQHLGHVSVYKKNGIDNFATQPQKFQISGEELLTLKKLLSVYSEEIVFAAEILNSPALVSTGNRSIPVMVEGHTAELEDFVRTHPDVKKWTPEILDYFKGPSFSEVLRQYPEGLSLAAGVSELLGITTELKSLSESDRELVLAGRTFEGDLNAVNAFYALKHSTGLPYVDDVSVRAPLPLLRDLLQTAGAEHLVLYLKDPKKVTSITSGIQKILDAEKLNLEAIPFYDPRIGELYNGVMGFLYVMVTFFSILILGASSLIIVNSVTMGVLERSKEMGTLRAIGFTPERVRSLFVKESIWLAIISSVIGIFISEFTAFVISSMGWTYDGVGINFPINLRIVVEYWFYILLSLAIIFISTMSAYLVVRQKTKSRISTLLMDSGASV